MVVITGASSGIGEACARLYARHGHSLLLLARRTDRLKALAGSLESHCKVDVQYRTLDVSNREAVETFGKEESRLLGETTILVNNAGLGKGLSTIQEGSTDDWEAMMNTNVMGLLYFTKAILPHLIKRGHGHIVNLGSAAARWVYPKGNIYCATKAAVHMLNEAMRVDLNGTGVRVTEIAPGMVETEFSVVRLGDKAKADAVYAGLTPLTAEDIADAIYWTTSRPAHVNIQEIVLYPTAQASTTLSHRTPKT